MHNFRFEWGVNVVMQQFVPVDSVEEWVGLKLLNSKSLFHVSLDEALQDGVSRCRQVAGQLDFLGHDLLLQRRIVRVHKWWASEQHI